MDLSNINICSSFKNRTKFKKKILSKCYEKLISYGYERYKRPNAGSNDIPLLTLDADFSEDYLICAGHGGNVIFFDISENGAKSSTGTNLEIFKNTNRSKIIDLGWFPFDNCAFTLCSIYPDKQVLYDITQEKIAWEIDLEYHPNSQQMSFLSEKSSVIAVCGDFPSVQLFDMRNYGCCQTLSYKPLSNKSYLKSSWSNFDPNLLTASSLTEGLVLWDIRKYKFPIKTIKFPNTHILDFSFIPSAGLAIGIDSMLNLYFINTHNSNINKLKYDLSFINAKYLHSKIISTQKIEHYNTNSLYMASISGFTYPVVIDFQKQRISKVSCLFNHLLPITNSYIFSKKPMVISTGMDGMVIQWYPTFEEIDSELF